MLFVLILVFASVAVFGYVVVTMVDAAVEERVIQTEGAVSEGSEFFPYLAFTTPRKLAHARIIGGYIAFIALFVLLSAVGKGPIVSCILSLVAAALGSWLPLVSIRRRRKNHLEQLESQVLELTTGLAGGLRSGQALPAALEAVGHRLPNPMSEEIATVLREYRLGLDLPDALANLARRVPCEDLTLLVGSIRLTQQAGGSLAEVLDKMVEMIRGRTEFQQKLKGMTAQGRFEAIAMSLAPLFVFVILYLIDKPLMLPLVTTTIGWITIICDVAWVLIGFFVIQRIVTIEV